MPFVSIARVDEFFLVTEFVQGTEYAADLDRIKQKGRAEEDDLARRGISACLVSEEGVDTFGGEHTITADPVDGTTNLAADSVPAW